MWHTVHSVRLTRAATPQCRGGVRCGPCLLSLWVRGGVGRVLGGIGKSYHLECPREKATTDYLLVFVHIQGTPLVSASRSPTLCSQFVLYWILFCSFGDSALLNTIKINNYLICGPSIHTYIHTYIYIYMIALRETKWDEE